MSPDLGVAPRILLVRLGAIGDVVNALVVANGLRRHVPGVHIGWATHPLSLPLVNDHPSVDRVHVWEKGEGLGGFRALVKELRAERYGIALDLQRLQKSALLARLCGAERVLGFDRNRAKEQSWLWTRERITPGPRREHMVQQYQRFLDLLRVPREPLDRTLAEDPVARAWAEALMQRISGGSAAPILLNLGASKEEKCWPEAAFQKLALSLLETLPGTPLILTGGPSDAPMGESVARTVPGVEQLAGRTSLQQLIELIRVSRGVVTGDTGAMHMAAALGVPTVALFGPSDPIRTGPYGAGHTVLCNDAAVPREDPRLIEGPRHGFPMSNTTPETVLRAVLETFPHGTARGPRKT